MNAIEVPASLRPAIRRLSRRLAIGLFLDVWPAWAAASLVVAALLTLFCRVVVPGGVPSVQWLWLAPLLCIPPAVMVCVARRYTAADMLALADSLGGGHGMVLALSEHDERGWADSDAFERAAQFALPRLRAGRQLARAAAALAFLAVVWWLPQRPPAQGSNAVLADALAADLTATMAALKEQRLITPLEEKTLEEEIARMRRAGERRVDPASWEAADALRERIVAALSAKQDGVKWATESLGRYRAAAQGGAALETDVKAQAAELTSALEALARSGLMAGAPAHLQQFLKGGALPRDLDSLNELAMALSDHLASTSNRFGALGTLGKEFGRFDPAEFPLESGESGDENGQPGSGAATRGRADAPLTWGKESRPFDRFKAQALPPGAARGPDDWAPLVVLPGAARESATRSAPADARQYAAAAGQNAWRRTLAARHQSAVRKYFEK